MKRIAWWIRRDLRLADNLTLQQARSDGDAVIPVFILDPRLLNSPRLAPARRQFLFDSLADLDAGLRSRGSYLVVRAGDPVAELTRLVGETGAEAVYFHRDVTPFARRRDARALRALETMGARTAVVDDLYLAAPEQVLKPDDSPYTVFTAYRRRWEERVALPPRVPASNRIATPQGIPSLDLPGHGLALNPAFAPGGEREAHRLLHSFVRRASGLRRYGENRNALALDSTSHLSPHLHFGTISARELVRTAQNMTAALSPQALLNPGPGSNVSLWIGELVWRDFFAQVLWHYPAAACGSFRREYDNLPWENDANLFQAWREGRTGYPVVDAGMRELVARGWMHNRARMIVASFLAKDLLIDWRWGERHFLQHLVDGDLASNNGGWQWAAGTGTDAQPFFRIFNPVAQGERFDAEGRYVRRWVPELARVPAEYIHRPWTMPPEVARAAGVAIGREYPAPIVDHSIQRERALALYGRKN